MVMQPEKTSQMYCSLYNFRKCVFGMRSRMQSVNWSNWTFKPRPRAVDYLFLFPSLLFQFISTPLSGREDTTRATRVLRLDIWQKQPSFFLISLCPLLFKNSAEKEKTIFQNLLAVISRKYSEVLRLSSLGSAGGRNMAGSSFCLLAAHDRATYWNMCFPGVFVFNSMY